MSVLEIDNLSIRFGGVKALQDITLRAGEWEIVGIIGPNGAGKTTLFNCITGFYTPTSGTVRHRGRDIAKLPVHARTALGLGRTFQNVGLVKNTTVIENVCTAQHLQVAYQPVSGILGLPASFTEESRVDARARQILELMELEAIAGERVADLPYGIQKRVEIAAVLATDPDVLLLDEPGSGMGPEEAQELGDLLLTLRKEFALTIVMIDHHVPLVTRISDYVYCLNFGEVLAQGTPDEVRRHPEVIRAYMGTDDSEDTHDTHDTEDTDGVEGAEQAPGPGFLPEAGAHRSEEFA